MLKRCLATAGAAALLAACSGSDSNDRPAFQAELRRTSFGYPHIKASDEKGAGYGVGYAFAQDNFCLLAEDVATVNGERSKHFGADASYDQDGSGGMVTNLPSDFFYKQVNDVPLVEASWARQSQEVKDLVLGYAAGVNRYLRETGVAALPDACRNATWVRNITELDVMRMMRRYALAGGGIFFIEAFYAAQSPASASASGQSGVRQPHPGYTPAAPGTESRYRNRLGSNGVALGRDVTESGKGLLLGNPHFPWTSPYRFYQLHVTIPDKVDALGAAISGFPMINIGHNGKVAWTHTVNSSTHYTLFYLELDPADSTRYLIDGVSTPLTKRELSVDIGNGQTATRTYYASEHGPLLVLPGLLEWSGAAAYAFRDANADNDRALEQWWQMNKARTLGEFKSSVETLLGLPWVNAIAVDAAGTAYFSDITVVPKVTAAKQAACVPPPLQPLLGEGLFVLAGNTAACQWDQTAGTPQPGIFAASELPSLTRTDYVQNSNDSAWLTNPGVPLTGYPAIVSIDGEPQGGRTRIGLQQIADRLSGADGLGGTKWNLAKLQQVAFNNRSYHASVLLDGLRSACSTSTTPDGTSIAAPCSVLQSWQGSANVDAIGWPLFDAWRNALDDSGVDYWATPFDPADGFTTPSGLRVADAAVADAARQALATAAADLSAQGIDFTKPWGEVQVALRNARRIPIHGGSGTDIYNAMNARPVGNGLLDAFYGSSTVITVSFETEPPITQGWLTFSQSTNPSSPHCADQTERFSRKEWITFPYTDDQIRADPNYTTLTISE
jgi:acyl-homoserine-lactone acylase